MCSKLGFLFGGGGYTLGGGYGYKYQQLVEYSFTTLKAYHDGEKVAECTLYSCSLMINFCSSLEIQMSFWLLYPGDSRRGGVGVTCHCSQRSGAIWCLHNLYVYWSKVLNAGSSWGIFFMHSYLMFIILLDCFISWHLKYYL